jgi:fucose 4-O-acetylase-like acetyltransferase
MKHALNRAPERVEWIDHARGVAITLVVLGHVIRGLRIEKVGPSLLYYERLDALIYSFHMPLFFLVSGILFANRSFASWRHFVRVMIIGIIVPYVLWTIAFVAIQNLARSEVNSAYEFDQLVNIWRYPIAHMWFLYALMFVQSVYYVIKSIFGNVGLMIVGAAWVLVYVFGWGSEIDSVAPGAAMGGAFFILGTFAVGRVSVPARSRQAAIIAALAAALWLGTYMFSKHVPAAVMLSPFVALCGIAMTLVICFMFRTIRGPITTGLGQVGQASIAIYVSQTIFAAGLRILLYHAGVFNCTLHVVAGSLVGLLIPVGLYILANQTKLAPYVGFGRTQKFLYIRWPKVVSSNS